MEYFYKVLAYEGKCYIGLSLSGLCVYYGFEKEKITDEDSKTLKKMESFLKEAEEDNIRFTSTRDAPMFIIASIFLDWVRETHPEFKFEAVFVGDEEERQEWLDLPPETDPGEPINNEDILSKEDLEELIRSIRNKT